MGHMATSHPLNRSFVVGFELRSLACSTQTTLRDFRGWQYSRRTGWPALANSDARRERIHTPSDAQSLLDDMQPVTHHVVFSSIGW